VFTSSDRGVTFVTTSALPLAGSLAVDVDRSDEHHAAVVVLASSSTAIFTTSDGGVSWTAATSSSPLPQAGYAYVAFDPTEGSQVWASFDLAGPGNECAVFQSSDGGRTFEAVTSPGSMRIRGIAAIGKQVYVPSSVGVLVSSDAGATWLAVSPATGAPSFAPFVAIDPSSPRTVWVSAVPDLGDPWIYRSTDGGATFAPVQDGLGSLGPIAVAPSNGAVVYASEQRTADGGATWSALGLFQ
jgi:photosystem II stability/assembly factor-like uncharacterized protein